MRALPLLHGTPSDVIHNVSSVLTYLTDMTCWPLMPDKSVNLSPEGLFGHYLVLETCRYALEEAAARLDNPQQPTT